MMRIDNSLFPYEGCGLDWVFLANGYTVHETPYGRGIAIQDADGLHALVLREIITSPHPIRGQELRFIRSMLDLSQEGMGKIIGVQRLQVTRMEANRKKPITPSADRAVRMFLALRQHDRDLGDRILELLTEFDDLEHERTTFVPSDHGWMRAA
jgi:DNA-binding transcriptional regulator YiaG